MENCLEIDREKEKVGGMKGRRVRSGQRGEKERQNVRKERKEYSKQIKICKCECSF